MSGTLKSVVISQKADGSWQAKHLPSGKITHGIEAAEAEQAMKDLLGMDEEGQSQEPPTSPRFEGQAFEIAKFLEGSVSEMLAFHDGYARLEAYESGIAHIRLGGGCQGCPSSRLTLLNGVKTQLQETFGEEQVVDVYPVEE